MFVIYWLPRRLRRTLAFHFSTLKKISALTQPESWFLNSKFRSLESNKCKSDFNEIYRNMLNDPKYTHPKNHINPKILSYKFWYWTKTATTFGEECTKPIQVLNIGGMYWRFCLFPSNEIFDINNKTSMLVLGPHGKDRKYSRDRKYG